MSNKLEFENLEKFDYSRREAFNSLRTNLSFCGVENKVIMLTSCTPNEGKSTVAVDLCRVLAEDSKKVLLIDADIRKSVLMGRHRIKSNKEVLGLSHYLSGQKKMEQIIYQSSVENFDLIIAGPTAPNPTELLGNDRFKELIEKVKEDYDIVLIDSPPLGWVIDAAVVAGMCDGAILVVESNAISYKFLQDVKKQLDASGVNILGAVLNKVKMEKNGYYNRYGKYGKYSKYGKYGKYSRYEGSYSQYGVYGEDVE